MVNIEDHDNSVENERIRKISDRYVEVMALLITEALQTSEISLSQILEDIKVRDTDLYNKVTEDRCIFLIALKLYDIGSIPVAGFYQSQRRVILQPSEEFNIEYCLVKIRDMIDAVDTIKEFTVDKMGDDIKISFEKVENGMKIVETIEMTDLVFRVVR